MKVNPVNTFDILLKISKLLSDFNLEPNTKDIAIVKAPKSIDTILNIMFLSLLLFFIDNLLLV